MTIEDYEILIRARRLFLSLETPEGSVDRLRQELLRADTRLEGPLFMEWERAPELDEAYAHALQRLLLAEETHPAAGAGAGPVRPPSPEAIRRTLAKLTGR